MAKVLQTKDLITSKLRLQLLEGTQCRHRDMTNRTLESLGRRTRYRPRLGYM